VIFTSDFASTFLSGLGCSLVGVMTYSGATIFACSFGFSFGCSLGCSLDFT